MRGAFLLLALAAALAGCETTRASLAAGPLPEVRREPNPFASGRGARAVRRAEIAPEAAARRPRAIRVEPFEIENFRGGGLSPREATRAAEEAMREALAAEGCFDAVAGPGAPAPEGAAPLRGAITELHPGGRAALDEGGAAAPEPARASLAVAVLDHAGGKPLAAVRASTRKGGSGDGAILSERNQRLALRELAGRAAREICAAFPRGAAP